ATAQRGGDAMNGGLIVLLRVKPAMADENQRLIEKVFEELGRVNPAGLRYASFRLADSVSFVHLAWMESADGANPLERIAAFGAFTKDIGARCDEQPVSQDATLVGSFRLPL